MHIVETPVVYRPDSASLRFLPEGPYPYEHGVVSWVAIQHGADSPQGSLNLLDVIHGENRSIELPGRPGFAFRTDDPNYFVAGVERRVQRVDIRTGECEPISDEVDADVENTIINDGVAFDEGIVFGCKHLEFSQPIAGLYLWRRHDRSLVRLRNDQICSNGKIISPDGDNWSLLDIDTPTKKVVRYELNVERGELSEAEVVLDLTGESMFPDGMIATPDGSGVIIAFYNPEDAPYGVAREYELKSGRVVSEWRCAGSPQVTCPQLVDFDSDVHLVLTTAVEHMPAERQAQHVEAGSIFMVGTRFCDPPPTPFVALK